MVVPHDCLSVTRISLNFNRMDLASSVYNFTEIRKSASSYWKPAKNVVTHDPFTKSKATSDPITVELEYYHFSFLCRDSNYVSQGMKAQWYIEHDYG